ncbi:hypothetical protein GCM10022232_87610 [Streptomyces plumbiresistens]|uniref:Transposase n=1 Tax=Streptomyces plumbiresistens TaxID=511811 RepID=A0ABP7TLT6_9ACTN
MRLLAHAGSFHAVNRRQVKNSRALSRHHARREHMIDIIQAVAERLSHPQTATTLPGNP